MEQNLDPIDPGLYEQQKRASEHKVAKNVEVKKPVIVDKTNKKK